MANPYQVLGVGPGAAFPGGPGAAFPGGSGAGDEEIRARYHALLRRFPPEREPAAFERIQKAYEKVRDVRSRLRFLLFEPSQGESFEEWIEEVRSETASSRLSLERIRAMFRP